MRRAIAAAGSAVLVLVCGVGCGGSEAPAPPRASASAPASTPTPTPTAPSKAEDTAALKKAIVGAADLGKPWVVAKKVATTSGKADEACPGQPSKVNKLTSVASLNRNLTEGTGVGVNIGTFWLATLPTEDAGEVKTAYAEDTKACRTFKDANKLYVVYSPEGPTSADGADEVLFSRAERLYSDKAHKQLAYARHTVVARTGRVVTYVSYAFLTTKKDPGAKDFSRTSRLLDIQSGKVASTFSG
jgi:hypothetical protein